MSAQIAKGLSICTVRPVRFREDPPDFRHVPWMLALSLMASATNSSRSFILVESFFQGMVTLVFEKSNESGECVQHVPKHL